MYLHTKVLTYSAADDGAGLREEDKHFCRVVVGQRNVRTGGAMPSSTFQCLRRMALKWFA